MSWLAVDKGGCEHIFAEKPCRNESNTLWICSVVYLYGQRYANTGCCYLPKGKPYSGVYEINVAFLLWEFNIKYQLKRKKK